MDPTSQTKKTNQKTMQGNFISNTKNDDDDNNNNIKDRQSIFKQAVHYTKECNITCTFDNASSSITVSNILSSTSNAKKITTLSPKAIKERLRTKMIEKYAKEAEQQSWLGAYTTKQLQDKQMPPIANQIVKKWKNIPHIIYSINWSICQQLLPTKSYQQNKEL